MAQVQLYLAKSQHGYTGLGNINPSEDVVRHIHDFGSALEILDFESSRPEIFYLVQYIEEGLLLTLLRPIDSHAGSNYSATLHFPLGLKISKEQFLNIVGSIKEVLVPGLDPGTETISELRQLLSADYGVDESRPHFRVSQGNSTAFVYIGEPSPTLGDFFDTRFYQPEYSDFNGVLLVDRLSGAKAREGGRELSGDLKTIYTVMPPKASSEGFVPTVFREAFRRPIMAGKGTTLNIVWRRSGFESINTRVTVDRDGMHIPVCNTSDARKLISPQSFYITEQNTRKLIKEFAAKVNGTEINGPTPFKFSELTHARVDITSPGYVSYSGNLDLAGSTQALIQMRKLHKSYRFDMPLLTPEPLEPLRIYIKTLKPLAGCPIEGYEIAGGEIMEGGGANSLIYVGRRNHLRNIFVQIAALVGTLLLGFLLGWTLTGNNVEEDIPVVAPVKETITTIPETEQVTAPVVEPLQEFPDESSAPTEEQAKAEESAPITAKTENLDYKAATDYLESNKSWNRDEMEAIPALRGLFDDLNNYNFERIKTHWAPLLKDSKRFNSVEAAVIGSSTKRNPRTGAHNPTYNKDGDNAINWRRYTYWVDP